jgi:hypothetical protein
MDSIEESKPKPPKAALLPLPKDLSDLLDEVVVNFDKIDGPLDTKIKETWPLYVVFGDGGNYHIDALSKVQKWIQLDQKIGLKVNEISKEPLLKLSLEKNELYKGYLAYKNHYDSISGINSGTSLEDVTGTKPTGFINKDITKFYEAFNSSQYKSKDKSKENTGDAVLLYGCSADDVYSALKNNKVGSTDKEESLCIILDNNNKETSKKFAIVSLKAGKGRAGRVLTFFNSIFGGGINAVPGLRYSQNSDENPQKLTPAELLGTSESYIAEIFQDIYVDKQLLTEVEFMNALRSSLTKLVTAVGKIPKALADTIGEFAGNLKKITNKVFGSIVLGFKDEIQSVKTKYFTLVNAEENLRKEMEITNEGKDDPIKVTHSFYINVAVFVKEVRKINYQSLIGRIVLKSKQLDNNKIFVTDVQDIDESTVTGIKDNINNIWNTYFVPLKDSTCVTKKVTCEPITLIDRESFKPMIYFNSNILAFEIFEKLLDKVLSQGSSLSDQKNIKDEFIKISSQISAEAIFGKNDSLPLIKYDGKKIQRLGKKKEYSISSIVEEKGGDFKVGKIEIKKSKDGNYFIIYLYLIFELKIVDDEVVPYYSLVELRNDSKSSFTFKAEVNKTAIPQDKVF